MKTPVLETGRLLLRPFNEDDVEAAFYGWEIDPDVSKYMMWESHNDILKTKAFIEEELKRIESMEWYRWAIVLKKTNELIGTCVIYYNQKNNTYDVGYNLSKKYWGKGFTTEALGTSIAFARDVLKLSELIGGCATVNVASSNVLKKLGFKYVANCPYDCGMDEVLEGEMYRLQL